MLRSKKSNGSLQSSKNCQKRNVVNFFLLLMFCRLGPLQTGPLRQGQAPQPAPRRDDLYPRGARPEDREEGSGLWISQRRVFPQGRCTSRVCCEINMDPHLIRAGHLRVCFMEDDVIKSRKTTISIKNTAMPIL